MPSGSTLSYLRGPGNVAQTTAGTSQATAAPMIGDHVSVPTTVEGAGLALTPGNTSDWFTVSNADSSRAFYVYPPSGARFNASTANAPLLIPPKTTSIFTYVSPTVIIATAGVSVPAPTFSSIGDSQVANAVTNNASTKAYLPAGALTQLRRITNQKAIFPLANQLGVGGTTWAAIKLTAAAAVATGAKFCVCCGGTNDAAGGLAALLASQQDAVDAFATLLAGGVTPIVIPVTRRTDGGKTTGDYGTDAFDDAFTDWLSASGLLGTSTGGVAIRAMSIAQAIIAPPAPGTRVIVCDLSMLRDASTHEPLANVLQADGLHHNVKIAITVAGQIASLLDAYGVSAANVAPSGTDLWALQTTNHGLLAGTGGSALVQAPFTGSGSVATGWQGNYSGGTATSTGVFSKVASLKDGTADRGQRVVVSGTFNATATEQINLQCLTQLTRGLAVGDSVYLEGYFKVNGPVNVRGVQMTLTEVGPGSPQSSQEAYSSNGILNFPTMGKMRTPPITLQSGITGLTVLVSYAFAGNIDVAGTSVDFGATIDVSDLRVMKL